MNGWIKIMSKPQLVKNKDLKAFLEANKRETRLTGAVERHILMRPFEERRQDVLHPSDIIKKEWCARAAYHALKGNYVETRDKATLRLQSIFDEGHSAHAKWQGYLAEMGVLYGTWGFKDNWGMSNSREADGLEYNEVPLVSDIYRISGHADGWVKGLGNDFLIEIKTIGAGTLRMEDPALFGDTQDIFTAWKNVRRPLASHYKQGQVYLHLCHLMVQEGLLESAPEEIVFIYELKADQDYKEFVVQYNYEHIKPVFDAALDVVKAVGNNKPPACTIYGSVKSCKRCEPFK
jgi:hypothetical protein